MSAIYFLVKLYPVLAISFGVVSWDLMRIFRRRENRAWIGMAGITVFCALSSIAWLVFRGDKNADVWFSQLMDWLKHS